MTPFMYKVTFLFLNQPKVLFCRKLEDGPMLFNTLVDIIKNPIPPNFRYQVKNQLLLGDSYEEFKGRTSVRIPINFILLVEQLDLSRVLKPVDEDVATVYDLNTL